MKNKCSTKILHAISRNGGFSLIEVLIYSALLALMMVGVLGGVYMIIQATTGSGQRQVVDDEANFVLRKIDWVLGGVTAINVPGSGASGTALAIVKVGIPSPVRFRLNSGNIEIDSSSGAYLPLDSEGVTAASLSFYHLPPAGNRPAAVRASFYFNDRFFTTTKYIRK